MARKLLSKTARLLAHQGGRPRVNIKKNDTVRVMSGKDRGKVARVLTVLPRKGLAIVEGVHFVKRHTRPNPSRNIKGGVVEKEGPIHVSNLRIVCPECKETTRVSRRLMDDGTKARSCKKCEQPLDAAS